MFLPHSSFSCQVYIDLNDVATCAAIMLPDGPLLALYLGLHHDPSNPHSREGSGLESISPGSSFGELLKQGFNDYSMPSFFQVVVNVRGRRLQSEAAGAGATRLKSVGFALKKEGLGRSSLASSHGSAIDGGGSDSRQTTPRRRLLAGTENAEGMSEFCVGTSMTQTPTSEKQYEIVVQQVILYCSNS